MIKVADVEAELGTEAKDWIIIRKVLPSSSQFAPNYTTVGVFFARTNL